MEIANNIVNPENGENGRRNKNQENQLQFACRQCGRRFRNNRGVTNHLRFCSHTPMDYEVGRPPPLAAMNGVNSNLNDADDVVAEQQFFLGNTPGNKVIEECYEKIVFWRKNLHMLPKGSSDRDYIKEITRLINEWLIEMCNVRFTCDAGVTAKEAVKVFKK